MTAHDDELTTRLNQELHDHVDGMHGSLLALDAVRGKAHAIRRRRAVVAVAAAAAAVAVLVPTAALASHHVGGKSHSLPPATQDVSPTPSTPTQTASDTPPPVAPGVLDVSDLPTGVAPRIEYVVGGTVLHQVALTTRKVGTRNPVRDFVRLSDLSTVYLTSDGASFSVEVSDASGRLHDPIPSNGDLATNTAHTVAAWITPAGQVMVLSSGTTQPMALGDPITAATDLRLGAVVGDDCAASTSVCAVYVNVADAKGAWQPWQVARTGSQRLLDGSFLSIADETEGGVTIGLTKVTDSGSCSKLAGGGEFQGWSTCSHTLDSISPDGSLVLAGPAYRDGIGDGVLAMYDASSGDLSFQRKSTINAQSYYQSVAWEDDTHVLATVFQDNHWSIVRFAADGSMEYAVPPVKGDVDSPFVLAEDG